MIIVYILLAYLCGSIPTGKIVGRYYKVDIQKTGSGNIGAANAHRSFGWRAGLVVLLGDTLKGFIPVLFAKPHLNSHGVMVVALAAILGHVFSIWLKFKGGKGIATGLGVTLAIYPLFAVLGLAIYMCAFACFKKSAVASLIAAWGLPLFSLILLPAYCFFYLFLAGFATWTHRTNIRQMIKALN